MPMPAGSACSRRRALRPRLGPDALEPGLPSVDLERARRRAARVRGDGRLERPARTQPRCASRRTAGSSSPRSAGVIKVFDNVNDPTAGRSSPTSARRSTTSGTAACWAWRSTRSSRPAGRSSTRSTPTTPRSAARRRAGATAARRLRAPRATAASSAAGCRSSSAGGVEQVLIEDWCQQYPSHSVGSLAFGADGALYVSGGDGASFNFADYGQDGSPVNPCGDPPGGVGGQQTPPTAEGGALRSQDLRTPADPTTPRRHRSCASTRTPAPRCPDNPNAGSADANARRIIANGLRNPFRFTMRPGTNELWIGDVGWSTWEEINRVPSPAAPVENFGWPCYEGTGRQASLRRPQPRTSARTSTRPARRRSRRRSTPTTTRDKVVDRRPARPAAPSIAGLAFYDGGTFPAPYNGALFFADYSRDCIWVMFPGANGLPDPATRQPFINERRRARWTSRSAPAATSTTPTSTAARSGASARRRQPRPDRRRGRDADERRRRR